jgi:D-xylose transport system substrate-binding protein
MKSKLRVLLCVAFCALATVSCGARKKAAGGPRIGFSAATDLFLLERWDKDIRVFSNVARELGAEVVFAKAPGNALSQIPQIQYLLEQDIDVLVVIPQDMDILGGVVKKAMAKGIPVLAYDRPIMQVPISGYVSFDNREVGKLLASALVSKVPRGNYLIVNGSIHDNNSFEVSAGVHEVLDPRIARKEISLVNEIWLDFWSFDEARQKIGKVLEKTTDIDAISCANDQLAGAAVSLLAESRLAGKVYVVGQDADLLACQRVVDGLQLMTVYKPLPSLAMRAAQLAVQMAKKEHPEPDKYFDNKSGTDIPFFVEKPTAVYKEQMEATVVEDGFHSREDVYRTEQARK